MDKKIFALFCLLSVNHFSFGTDWHQFLGPNRTGVITDEKFKGSLGNLEEKWTIQLGSGFGGAVTSKDEFFVLDRNDQDEDIVKCFDLATAKLKWENKYKNPGQFSYPGSRSLPAVDDNFVFTVGSIGDVVCTDRKTGKKLWHKNLKNDYGSEPDSWGFGQSPLLYGDTVIFAPLAKKGVVALKKSDGSTVWESAEVGKKNGYSSPILVKFLNQEMILQQASDELAALDPQTGKIIWKWQGYNVKWAIPAPVVVSDNTLFITGGYGSGSVMIKVTKEGNDYKVNELFRSKLGCQIHAPIHFNGHIYGNFNENDNLGKRNDKQGLTCLDLKGNVLWKTGDQPNLNRGSVILINDHLLALDGDTGELILSKANPEKYQEVQRKKVLQGVGKNIWSPICYINGYVIVRDQKEMKMLKLY